MCPFALTVTYRNRAQYCLFFFFVVVVTDNGVLGHTITNVVGEEEGGRCQLYLGYLRRDMYSTHKGRSEAPI